MRSACGWTSGLLFALGAWGIGGCSTPREATAARPVAAPAATRAERFDPRLVDPRFEAALARFRRDLRGLDGAGEDAEIRKALRLFAIAVEKVPHAGGVDVTSAGRTIRGGRFRGARRAEVAIGAPRDGAHLGAMQESLMALARTMIELARGPYRDGTGVLAAAYAFDGAARAVRRARGTAAERRAILESLRRAEEALLALRAALGRGEVGLLPDPGGRPDVAPGIDP